VTLVERELRPDDAEALAALVRACDETYREWLPPGWTPPEVGADWTARFAEPDRWSLVMDAGGEIAGFMSFRPAYQEASPGRRAGALLPGVAHVGAVFVHPSRWRQGIAARMLARAEAAMRAAGYERAVLWTPEGAPAERLYAAQGWERDGRRAWHDWIGVTVVGYAKRLA
jgi:GNAT superfamily N-acetyltransferase